MLPDAPLIPTTSGGFICNPCGASETRERLGIGPGGGSHNLRNVPSIGEVPRIDSLRRPRTGLKEATRLPHVRRTVLSRVALAITLTEDSAMAAAAMIGDSRMPNTGYSTPAATGTPAAL